MSIDSSVGELLALAKRADESLPISDVIALADGRKFVASRNDVVIKDITNPAEVKVLMPELVTQHVKLTDAGSLSHYMNRFKNDESILFASIAHNSITGVIDYHGRSGSDGKVDPKLGRHQATLNLPFSKEWTTWMGQDQKLLAHVEFANFLEENALDVASPMGADLLEICRDLQVRQDMHFSSAVRMGDTVSVSYQKDEDATTKSNMSLPIDFTLAIPVYFNEPPVAVRCMMRRSIKDGELRLGYKMIRAENIRQDDFQRIVGEIEANTGLDAVYGSQG